MSNNATNTSTPYNYSPCTYATCSVHDDGQIRYIPSLAGNTLYLTMFALLAFIQLLPGIKHRTWGYLASMLCGLILEIIGYVGRILLHYDDFNFNNFIIYIVCLTIGPAFFSAAIYLCLARIIAVYGVRLCPMTPRTITLLFVGCDFLSLVLQAAGGAIASTAADAAGGATGVNIMIAGLATQVASMTAFVGISAKLARNMRRNAHLADPNFEALRESRRFRGFLLAIVLATLAILIRCVFRVAELSGGFSGSLANNQVSFMILEGAMMVIAALLLTTAGHPGPVFGAALWKSAGFHLRKSKLANSPLGETPAREVEGATVQVRK